MCEGGRAGRRAAVEVAAVVGERGDASAAARRVASQSIAASARRPRPDRQRGGEDEAAGALRE